MSAPTFIYTPSIQWKEVCHQRPHQLFKEFARRGYRSIFCNYRPDGGAPVYSPSDNLFIINDLRLLSNYVSKVSQTIWWITYPPTIRYVTQTPRSFIVFDYIDKVVEEFAHWNVGYDEILKVASVVTCTSQDLYEEISKRHSRVYLVPNGCEFDYLNKFSLDNTPTTPIIGFSGCIQTWIDQDLLIYLAKALPSYELWIVGPVYTRVHPSLLQLRNVKFLGPHNYSSSLPRIMSKFDVGIIPFQVRAMTRASDPIKLYEYLAMGLTVVSTDIPSCHGKALIALNYQEFVDNVVEAVSSKLNYIDKNKELARQNSWSSRVDLILDILRERGVKL